MTIVDPKTLPWRDVYGPEFDGYNFWSFWNWSGLESIRLPEFRRTIVCTSPYQKHDFPECQLDPYEIMETIGKENGGQFKNLPFFAKAYNEMFVEVSDDSELGSGYGSQDGNIDGNNWISDWADFFKE